MINLLKALVEKVGNTFTNGKFQQSDERKKKNQIEILESEISIDKRKDQ